jgi:hypothetical protein
MMLMIIMADHDNNNAMCTSTAANVTMKTTVSYKMMYIVYSIAECSCTRFSQSITAMAVSGFWLQWARAWRQWWWGS